MRCDWSTAASDQALKTISTERLPTAWPTAGEGRQRWFDRRTERLVSATAAGIEAMLGQRHEGREPHRDASRTLVDQIRSELRDVAGIVLA